MRFLLIMIAIISLSIGCKKDSEKYIAKVNGSGIDRDKFDDLSGKRIAQIEKFGRKITPTQKYTFQKRLLENLINEELLLQEAKKLNVSVTDEEVKKKLATIKARYPKKEEFDKILKQQNLTENDLMEMFEKQLTIESLMKKEVINKIPISDDRIKKYYTEHKTQFDIPEKVQASHILLKSKEKKGSKEEKAEGKKLSAELAKIKKDIERKNISFADAAKKHSACPSKDRGGDLGLFQKGRMVKEFEKVAFAIKPGIISDPFKSPFGYHILKVTKKEKARTKTFEDAKEEIKERLKRKQSNKKIKAYLNNLKSNAKIESYLSSPPKAEKVSPSATVKATKEPKTVAKTSPAKQAESEKNKPDKK